MMFTKKFTLVIYSNVINFRRLNNIIIIHLSEKNVFIKWLFSKLLSNFIMLNMLMIITMCVSAYTSQIICSTALTTDDFILQTERKRFYLLSWDVPKTLMNQPLVILYRYIYDSEGFSASGFTYFRIGL